MIVGSMALIQKTVILLILGTKRKLLVGKKASVMAKELNPNPNRKPHPKAGLWRLQMKLCNQCSFYFEPKTPQVEPPLCTYPKATKKDPVTGKIICKQCDLHRNENFFIALAFGLCGKSGRWWEQKVAPPETGSVIRKMEFHKELLDEY